MYCPFHYSSSTKFNFGVSGDFVDFVEAREEQLEEEYNTKYPSCWDKFLHWLGLK